MLFFCWFVGLSLLQEKVKGKHKLVPRLLGISRDAVMRVDEKTKEVIGSSYGFTKSSKEESLLLNLVSRFRVGSGLLPWIPTNLSFLSVLLLASEVWKSDLNEVLLYNLSDCLKI